jgi:hypothetical protein
MTPFKGVCAAALLVSASLASHVQADVINDWNEQWWDTIRAVGGPPCPLARNQAILFTSIFDAVNSVDRQFDPFLKFSDVAGPVDKSAAVAAAAHQALVSLYPARKAIYDNLYNAQLAQIANGAAETNGIALGVAAANAILADRSTDQTNTAPTYVYGTEPGAYRPTPPDFTTPPFNPGWGTTKPWCMVAGNQFRPTGPLGFYRMDRLLKSAAYATQFNEVKKYGKRNSNFRTAEQTEIAWFWANDRNGTFKPPGHLMYATQVVADQQGLNLDQKARLYALAAIAMGDAGLVAWDQKYSTNVDLWRPVSAIRLADTDGNPATTREKGWLPLLDFSPPFPAYTSGHATFGAAHAAVMEGFFGTDDITFTIGTDEPAVANVTRTFHSFSEAARENGLSRVYLGVHFRCDADSGFSSGTLLGNYVINNMLLPRDCSGDMNHDGKVNSADMRVFNEAYFAGNLLADMNSDNDVTTTDYQIFVGYYFAGCE